MYQSRLKSLFLTSILIFWGWIGTAQISFESNESYLKLSEKSIYPVGCTDLNGDYHDDIILTPDGRGLNIYYQSGSSRYALGDNNSFGFPSMITTVTSGDINRDGRDEILVSGFYSSSYVYSYSEELARYTRDTILRDSVFAQGSNTVDINSDGALDFFICHDDWNNLIYLNDGLGNMEYDVSNIVAPVDVSVDNSGNYGSEWIDFDDDGDLDLYIAKCRLGVSDTSDIRRKNALYVNDGNGRYSEKADEYNLGSGWQSWLSQWGDIDNDGDLDVLVLNHDHYHQLFRNESGVFVEDTLFGGELLTDSAEQGIMQDYDNDGDLDVLVCGFENYMLWNDGTGYFSKSDNPFGPVDAYSGAVGDFDSNGFLDVVAVNVGQVNDRIYESVGNDNNYIKFSLNGLESNKEGIGSQVFIYGDFGIQRRDIKAGESYGIINSSSAHFGLSQYTLIDSVVVKWPSGIRDTYHQPAINQQYIITEGQCIQGMARIQYNGELSLCSGDSIILKSNITSPNIVWSDGSEMTENLVVKEQGVYSFKVLDPVSKCVIQSELVHVSEYPDRSPLRIVSDGDPVICDQPSLTLYIDEFDFMQWSTGDTTSVTEVSSEGWYSVQIEDLCTPDQEDSIYITRIDPLLPVVTGDSIMGPGVAELRADGDSLQWYMDQNSQVLLSTLPTYTPYVEKTTSFYVSNIESKNLPSVPLGEETHTGVTMFSNDAINAGMEINVYNACTIKSVEVYSDVAGSRTINLYDFFFNQILDSYSMLVPAGEWTTIPIDFKIEDPGLYILSTDEDLNLQNLGHIGPRLARSFEVPLEYPYVLEDVLEIRSSTFGSEYYYYFYNWQIEYPSILCESDRVEVIAYVDDDVAVNDINERAISVYPNPFSNKLTIDFDSQIDFNLFTIRDLWGRELLNGLHAGSIDLKELPIGTYFLELHSLKSGNILRHKIVKTH